MWYQGFMSAGTHDSVTGISPRADDDPAAAGAIASQLPPVAAGSPLPASAAPPEPAVVTEARERRLAEMKARYPRWAIWADCLGWHARRKGSFHQQHEPDSPSYSVHEADSHMLAIRLRDEDAADVPAGDWSP